MAKKEFGSDIDLCGFQLLNAKLVNSGSYMHVQNTAATLWNVTHNLGFKPAGIYVEDTAGDMWTVQPEHVDNNNLNISFGNAAVAGYALLS